MFHKTVGFVGGGWAARILLGGWKRAGLQFPRTVVADSNNQALARLDGTLDGLECVAAVNNVAAADSPAERVAVVGRVDHGADEAVAEERARFPTVGSVSSRNTPTNEFIRLVSCDLPCSSSFVNKKSTSPSAGWSGSNGLVIFIGTSSEFDSNAQTRNRSQSQLV